MKLNRKEQKLVLKWFDVAIDCGDLDDVDLKLFDKIKECFQEEDCEEDDPLIFNPSKNKETYRDCDEECCFDMDCFSDEDY